MLSIVSSVVLWLLWWFCLADFLVMCLDWKSYVGLLLNITMVLIRRMSCLEKAEQENLID